MVDPNPTWEEDLKKPVDSFPPEVRTNNTRNAVEFMPPILDNETGVVEYYCVLCKQTKTAEPGEPINFFFKETAGTSQSGNCCPECYDKKV